MILRRFLFVRVLQRSGDLSYNDGMSTLHSIVIAALLILALGAANAEDKPGLFKVSDSAGLLAAASKIGSDGGSIVLEPGTYEIKQTILFDGKSNVNITGSGWNTVIRRAGDGDAIVFKGNCWSCAVRNLAIEGDPKAKSGSGIVFKEGQWSGICVVDYCHIRSFVQSGVRFEGDPKTPFSSNTVSNCWFTNNMGDQLYSRHSNDFYITGNQFGSGGEKVPHSAVLLDHSSAGSYTLNYHWGHTVALRMIGSNFNRIENNRFEQSRENGILIGDPKGGDACMFTIITGNTIHTNSETNSGKYSAVEAYDAVETTFCTNQIFSWNSEAVKAKHGLVIGRGCKDWIVKDNNIRHVTEQAIVYDKKAGHIVKDNLVDEPKPADGTSSK